MTAPARPHSGRLAAHLGSAIALWTIAAMLYSVVEDLTNWAVGLHLPPEVLLQVLGIHAIAGACAGVGAGLALWAWRWLRAVRSGSVVPFHAALFVAGLVLAYAGLRINDRFLPDFIAPESLAVNALLAVLTLALGLTVHSTVKRRGGTVRAFLLLVLAAALFVSVGLYVDTFELVGTGWPWTVVVYVALGSGCVLLSAAGLWVAARPTRSGLVVGAGVAALAVALGLHSDAGNAAVPAQGTSRSPNVVWLVLDTVRADHLSTYGYDRPTTPRIDRIAAEGAVFEAAISGSSWTIPSHYQMVTGLFSAGNQRTLGAPFQTAAEILGHKGYRTAAVLANISLGRRSGFEQGFDTLIDAPPVLLYLDLLGKFSVAEALANRRILSAGTVQRLLYKRTFMQSGRADADVINDHALPWLRAHAAEPMFLFINYLDPHEPYDPPEPFRTRFAPEADPEAGLIRYDRYSGRFISTEVFTRNVIPRMTPERWQDVIALYDAEIAFLDSEVGRLVDELERLGIWDDTILVITSDHGELFGEHDLATHFKALTEEEIHVPLIVRHPPRIPAGTRVETPVQLVDVLPTVLDLLGDRPEGMDGTSLLPLVDGEPPRSGGETYSFLLRKPRPGFPHTAPGDLVAIRTPRRKYVWSAEGLHQYFDLVADPEENHDLLESGAQPAELVSRVAAWRRQIGLDSIEGQVDDRLTEERLRLLGYIE